MHIRIIFPFRMARPSWWLMTTARFADSLHRPRAGMHSSCRARPSSPASNSASCFFCNQEVRRADVSQCTDWTRDRNHVVAGARRERHRHPTVRVPRKVSRTIPAVSAADSRSNYRVDIMTVIAGTPVVCSPMEPTSSRTQPRRPTHRASCDEGAKPLHLMSKVSH